MHYLRTMGELSLHCSCPAEPVFLSNSKCLTMLSLLATMPGHTALRDYVTELLWPCSGRQHGQHSLRQAIYRVCKHAGERLLEGDRISVALNTAVLQVDIWDFHRAIRSGHYAHAVRLYRGSFLAGFERKLCAEAQGWIEAENQRIRSGLEVAFSRLVNDALKNDNAELACVYAQRYVDLNPLDDYAQELLLESYRLAGDSVGAFQAYQAYRATLKEAVGAEPPRQLQEGAVRLRKRLLTTGA